MAYRRPEVNWLNTIDSIDGYEGFVYRITHKETGRSYIGKKSYWSRTTKKVEGRKNRKRFLNESDWKKYTSSEPDLKQQVRDEGPDNFIFEILRHCRDKRELTYYETYYQFKENVLLEKLENGEYKYYNSNILGKFFRGHFKD